MTDRRRRRRLALLAVSVLLVSACSPGGRSDDGSSPSTAPVGPDPTFARSPLATGACPSPVVIMAVGVPSLDHSELLGLAPKGTLIPTESRFTGDIVDPRTGDEVGLALEVRFVPDARKALEVLATDSAVLLAQASTDEVLAFGRPPLPVAVVAPRERSPRMVYWDPARYPDVLGIADLAAYGVKVHLSAGRREQRYLRANGFVKAGSMVLDADPSAAAFVEERGTDSFEGDVTVDPARLVAQGWTAPIRYQLLADTGFDPYPGALVTRRQWLTDRRDCLARLVPLVQTVQTQLLTDTPAVARIIERARRQAGLLIEGDTPLAQRVDAIRRNRLVGNGGDATLGDLDERRFELVALALKKVGVALPTDLDPASLLANDFVDPLIGLPR